MIRWDVDDRRAHLFTRAYTAGMWLRRDKEAFAGDHHTLAVARDLQSDGDAPPTRLTRLRTRVRTGHVAGLRTWTVTPRRTRPVVRVVHLHGGGYVHPLTADYWRLARAFSQTPAEVVVPAYPLAPDATVDDVLPRLVDLVTSAEDASAPLPTVVSGDSAGGALALAVAAQLRERGGPVPAGLVLLSPWLDATLGDPEVADLEPADPMLAESGLRAAGAWWAGRRGADDPMVSPVNGDLAGLPPTHLWIGRHDILRPAVDRFAAHAERDGLDLHVHEVTAMFHVWMTRAVPEAARTRRELQAVLRLLA